jgi:hypothetical protein
LRGFQQLVNHRLVECLVRLVPRLRHPEKLFYQNDRIDSLGIRCFPAKIKFYNDTASDRRFCYDAVSY